MLNEIAKIPGNQSVFDDLKRLLAEKKAVAFVGAGASAGLYPLWGQLIRQLCAEAVASGFASEADRQFWLSMADTKPGQVADSIRHKVGSPQFGGLLRNIFGPKPDGPRHTLTHAALMRVPFSGYITTNYDSGLLEARHVERSAITAVGWSTWRGGDEFERWRDPTQLALPSWCPVLFAHGFYQQSDTIILGIEAYRRAYAPGPWRRLFEHLWTSAYLVFVGFGFSDPFLDFLTGEIVSQLDLSGRGKHIAFVGLGRTELYSEERRRFFLQNYNVRPIFYPVAGNDHSALLELLNTLAPKSEVRNLYSPSSPLNPALLPTRWVHETTNDDKFTGRQEECARLDRWVAAPMVRIIGICAVGGAGKTALMGHWLKNTASWFSRPFAGLFAWSFYQNRSSTSFLVELLKWAHENFLTPPPSEQAKLIHAALRLLRTHNLVVVLDGLEVLQEGPADARFGVFLDGTLREFLSGLCAGHHNTLAVLTSRFVFPDLARHLGTSFHLLELPGLASEQGSTLLADLEVHGSHTDREYISRRLEGHPLGLRIFAEALPDLLRDQPRDFLIEAFHSGQLSPDSPLAGKVRRLLEFYQKKLPPIQVGLLGVVALFRTPVSKDVILPLAAGLMGDGSNLLPIVELNKLHSRGVLTREPIANGHGYACHPILRDHFRAVLLGTGATVARKAADLLKGPPSGEIPRTVEQTEPVLLAIELLLNAGEFLAADELYRSKLADGRLCKWLPALTEGLNCALEFVRDEPRRQQCEGKLSQARMRYYLNEVGLFASLSGHYELASRFYADRLNLARRVNDLPSIIIGLHNQSDLLVRLGFLESAISQATEALGLALGLRDRAEICYSISYRGWARMLSGQVRAAAEDFAIVNAIERMFSFERNSIFVILWGELLLRAGHSALAERKMIGSLQWCRQENYRARFLGSLGACALAEAQLETAESRLNLAEKTFHSGQMLFDLARVHITAGQVAIARLDAITAIHRAEEALELAQPRGMRLIHADALVLRGRARLLKPIAPGESYSNALAHALDDADDALRIALECGYAWAELDAVALRAAVHAALAQTGEASGNLSAGPRHREIAHRAHTEASASDARLHLTEGDLKEAESKAAAWLEALLGEWKREKTGT